MEPTSPANCKHKDLLFVVVGREVDIGDLDNDDDHDVRLCIRCGQFRIVVGQNDEHVAMKFRLISPEQVEAATQYINYLKTQRQGKIEV